MTEKADNAATLVLVGGHESALGTDLTFVSEYVPGVIISAAGRTLHNTVSRLLARNNGPVIVVPMTFGRNPTFVADTAKTLKWLAVGHETQLALADEFGSIDHLTAWLRTAATQIRKSHPDAAVVIAAATANPFDDAELYRIAHLVRTHGAGNEVDVALIDEGDALLSVLQKLRRLGFDEAVVVPAGFQRSNTTAWGTGDFAGASFYGPLMSEQAIVRVIRERLASALHQLSHGRNGIDAGLMADHGHGYAHSHAFEEANGTGHSHGPGGHTHSHGHAHTPVATAADAEAHVAGIDNHEHSHDHDSHDHDNHEHSHGHADHDHDDHGHHHHATLTHSH